MLDLWEKQGQLLEGATKGTFLLIGIRGCRGVVQRRVLLPLETARLHASNSRDRVNSKVSFGPVNASSSFSTNLLVLITSSIILACLYSLFRITSSVIYWARSSTAPMMISTLLLIFPSWFTFEWLLDSAMWRATPRSLPVDSNVRSKLLHILRIHSTTCSVLSCCTLDSLF